MTDRPLLALRLRAALPCVAAFFNLVDDLHAEGFEVAGIAAGDEAGVGDDFAIEPFAAGIDHVGLDRLVGSHLPTAHRIDFDQQPRRMTDRSDDLARVEEIANELQRLGIDAQQVGIDLTAGQHDRVVIVGAHLAEHFVDVDAFAPVLALPAANLTLLRRYDYDFGARVPQPL